MKHLRKYNESKVNLEEVKYFCEIHLAYLTDMGYYFDFNTHSDVIDNYNIETYYSIWITKNPYFRWLDIKDYFIPFLTVLDEKYDLYNQVIFEGVTSDSFFKIEEVLNDEVSDDYLIGNGIELKLKLK
jgi:hypothetical protein